jgi:chromosome partitioning protein
MSRILAVANIKGGVGKTTTVVNLAAALAERNLRVLAIDLDPQASLTLSLGQKPENVFLTVRQMLEAPAADPALNGGGATHSPDENRWRAENLSPIRETNENWDYVPSNVDLRALEHELELHPHRIPKIAAGLQPLRSHYDFILLDCPASTGPLIGGALAAADQVIIPLTPDYLAFQVSRTLFRIVHAVRGCINPRLKIGGIFLTMYDSRTRHARDLMTLIHQTYHDVPFFSAVVRHSVKVKEAPALGMSVVRYAPDSQAAKAYRIIAEEIVQGIQPAPPPAFPGYSEDQRQALSPVVIVPNSATAFPPAREANPTVNPGSNHNHRTPDSSTLARPNPNLSIPPFLQASLHSSTPLAVESEIESIVSGSAEESMAQIELRAETNVPSHAVESQADDAAPVRASTYLDPFVQIENALEKVRRQPRDRLLLGDLERELERLLFMATEADSPRLLQTANQLVEYDHPEYAEPVYARAAELDPASYAAWLGWARTTPNPRHRVTYLQRALALQPIKELRAELAVACRQLQEEAYRLLGDDSGTSDSPRMAEAHRLFQQALTIDPADDRAWLGSAKTADNLVAKIHYLKQALKHNPQNKEAKELYLILGSFANGEPKERWGLTTPHKSRATVAFVILGVLLFLFVVYGFPSIH